MAEQITLGGAQTFFLGEAKTIRLELLDSTGAPVSMTAWTMLFDVRVHDNSTAPAVLSKTPTVTGTYATTRDANTQRAEVALTAAETAALSATTYRCSWARTDTGTETVLAWGTLTLQEATAL